MIRFILAAFCAVSGLPALAINIQEVTSPGGIEAWLVEEDQIPFIAIEMVFEGGANLDDPARRGATNLMMALLEEGSGEMDARVFQEAREGLAASFGFNAYDDTVTISAQFLTENKDEAVALLRQAIIEPRFDDDAIERVRAQVQSIIRSDLTDPNSIAGQTFNAAAFGSHPYGSAIDGRAETVSAITRDDLITAHRNALVRNRVYVGAAGDISAVELGVLIDALLGDLPLEGPDLPASVMFGLEGGLTIVPFETPQSVALFGHRGIRQEDDDFFAAYLLNEILGGGGLESRLMREVREERGLTYGVYTYLVSKDFTEIYLGSVASANDRIAEALDVIRDEWALMAREGVTEDELEAAKRYLTGAYPLRFDGNANIAGILVGMQAMGLPTEYIANRNDYVNAVTLEDINRVAARLLDPEALHFVVVGQPVGLGEDIE